MKNLLTACLPALALFALGGCAGTSAITSSEDDGVYYSSKDRTTAIVSMAPTTVSGSTDEAANPDYNGGSSSNPTARQNTGSDQYYDNTYTYMKGVPSYGSSTFYGPGVSYYTPYSAYTSLSYGWGGGACGFSPYAYGGYDPFYSSFYSPFGYGYSPYGYGSGLSVSFGFGRPWGYGYGGFGSPYGYGYGGLYSPYYYNSPFYGGYYGRGGYYGNNYYGNSYGGGYNEGNRGNGRTYGRRADRSSDGRYSSGGGVVTAPGGTTGPIGGGRVRSSERVAMPGGAGSPNTPTSMPNTVAADGGRVRGEMREAAAGTTLQPTSGSYNNRPRRMEADAQPQYRNMEQLSNADPNGKTFQGQGNMQSDNSRGRWRNTADIQPQSTQQGQIQPATNQPQDGRRRGGFFQNVFSEPSNNGGQAAQPQRTYDQPRQRTYEQPQQRTYEQPQRSYSQPSSQPSYSAPSYGGGGGGGGGGNSRSRGN